MIHGYRKVSFVQYMITGIHAMEIVVVHWLFKEQMEDLCWLESQVGVQVVMVEDSTPEFPNLLNGSTMKFQNLNILFHVDNK